MIVSRNQSEIAGYTINKITDMTGRSWQYIKNIVKKLRIPVKKIDKYYVIPNRYVDKIIKYARNK
jgi:hypothetical protein